MYYSEKLNSISHLVGAVFALVGLGALPTVGLQSGNPWVLWSCVTFGLTLVLLYTMTTSTTAFTRLASRSCSSFSTTSSPTCSSPVPTHSICW